MRRIVILAAATALTAATPTAWAQDLRPLSPAQPGAPAGDPTKPAAKALDPAGDAEGAPPPKAPAVAGEDASAHADVPISPQPGDRAPPPPPNTKNDPPKPGLAEAGGSAVGGILGTAAGTAVGGPLGGAAAGFVGDKIDGGLVRGVKKVFGGGKKKVEAQAGQPADGAPPPGPTPG